MLLRNLTCLAAMAVSSVLLAELGARALYGRPPRIDRGSTSPHPVRVATPTPGFKGEHAFRDGDDTLTVPFSVSSQGLSDTEYGPKKDGEYRIFMLGDSYTAGLQVRQEERIPKVVEARLRRRLSTEKIAVINGGVSGYGPWQERSFLQESGFPLEPDLVVLQVLPANDIDNTLCKVDKYPEAYNTGWRRRYHSLENRNRWQVKADRRLCESSRLYSMLSERSGRSYFIKVLNHIPWVPPFELKELPTSAPRNHLIEVNLRNWYPILDEGWKTMQEDIKGIQNDCRERNIDLLIYSVPVQDVIRDDAWRNAVQGLDLYERDKDSRIIEDFCRREDIPFIPILPALKNYPDTESLYYELDAHFTPAGAKLVGETIADFLCADYFAR